MFWTVLTESNREGLRVKKEKKKKKGRKEGEKEREEWSHEILDHQRYSENSKNFHIFLNVYF